MDSNVQVSMRRIAARQTARTAPMSRRGMVALLSPLHSARRRVAGRAVNPAHARKVRHHRAGSRRHRSTRASHASTQASHAGAANSRSRLAAWHRSATPFAHRPLGATARASPARRHRSLGVTRVDSLVSGRATARVRPIGTAPDRPGGLGSATNRDRSAAMIRGTRTCPSPPRTFRLPELRFKNGLSGPIFLRHG
jgi:hypothetical protein